MGKPAIADEAGGPSGPRRPDRRRARRTGRASPIRDDRRSGRMIRRGTPGKLAPPIDDINSWAAPVELAGLNHSLVYSFVGAPETVSRGVRSFLETTQADELIDRLDVVVMRRHLL